jgi:hypothetical protein
MVLTHFRWQHNRMRHGSQITTEYPGAIYHLMKRGDRREPIFRDMIRIWSGSLRPLAKGCFKTGWQVHAYNRPSLEPERGK